MLSMATSSVMRPSGAPSGICSIFNNSGFFGKKRHFVTRAAAVGTVGAVQERGAAEPGTDKAFAGHDSVHCDRQLAAGVGLQDVAAGAGGERGFGDFPGAMLADEQNPGSGVGFDDAAGGVDAADPGESDVEQNQIQIKVARLPDRFQPIRGIGRHLPIGMGVEHRTEIPAPRFVIVNQ